MGVDKSLVSGSTSMLILRLLSEYPLLHSMEEKGFLESYEQEAVGKVRKYYHLTKSGKKQLHVKAEEWKEYSRAVVNVMGTMGNERSECYGQA